MKISQYFVAWHRWLSQSVGQESARLSAARDAYVASLRPSQQQQQSNTNHHAAAFIKGGIRDAHGLLVPGTPPIAHHLGVITAMNGSGPLFHERTEILLASKSLSATK